jgi:hypothetical protein
MVAHAVIARQPRFRAAPPMWLNARVFESGSSHGVFDQS